MTYAEVISPSTLYWHGLNIPDVVLWFEPQSNLIVSSGNVDSWTSTVGSISVANTGSNRPTTETLNGITIPSFAAGSSQYLQATAAPLASEAGTIFAVVVPDVVTGSYVFSQSDISSAAVITGPAVVSENAAFVSSVNNGSGDTTLSADTAYLLTYHSDGTNWSLWVQTNSESVSVSGSDGLWFADIADLDTITVGATEGSGGVSGMWDGGIAEIIVTNTALAGSDTSVRERVWKHLNNKYALGLTI